MIRFYILPIEQVGNYRGPKYLKWRFNPDGINVAHWSMKDYGMINAALVAAEVTDAQHAELSGYSDVAAAPLDIDANVSAGALPRVVQVLEALRIPAGWVTTDYTYRDLLRMVGGLFMFAQRYHGMYNEELITSQTQLDLRWNEIPLARRQKIVAAADDLDYQYGDVQGTWTVRRILRYLADQWGATPILFGFVTL